MTDDRSPPRVAAAPVMQVEVPEYRSLSSLAVLALVLGLASATVMIGPFFLVVAGAAVGTALLALARIRSSEGSLTGSLPALAGLALAVAFSVAATVRLEVRNAYYRQQIDAVAQRFVDLLADQQYEPAIAQLTARAAGRLRPQTGRGQPAPPDDQVLAYAISELRDNPLAQALAHGRRIELEFEQFENLPEEERGSIMTAARYRMRDEGRLLPERLVVQFLRTPGFEAEGTPWRVDDWGLRAAN
jgi:hypothetical protein